MFMETGIVFIFIYVFVYFQKHVLGKVVSYFGYYFCEQVEIFYKNISKIII